jgi:protein subunit release factor A
MSDIPPEDLKIESSREQERGGQHVGWVNPGIKITHIPTDTVAICQIGRSQHVNRMIAMDRFK